MAGLIDKGKKQSVHYSGKICIFYILHMLYVLSFDLKLL